MTPNAPGSTFKRLQSRVMSLWALIQKLRPFRTFSRFTDVGGSVLSAGMSFQALFAVFAALWVGFGILARVARDNDELIQAITEQVNIYVPGLIEVDGEGIIPLAELLNRGSFDIAGVIASVSLLWVSITWFTGTRRAIRLIFGFDVKQYRNAILLKLRDFAGAVTFFFAILLSASLTVVSSGIFSWVLEQFGVSENNWFVSGLGVTVRYLVMFIVDTAIIMGIMRFLAEVEAPFKKLLPGSIIGGIAMLLLKLLATTLLSSASSNPLLATFAVIIGLLVWFNLVCRMLLLTASWIATGFNRNLGLPENGQTNTASLLD